jgi:hypothetical protein
MLGMSYTVVVDQAVWHHTEADPKAHKIQAWMAPQRPVLVDPAITPHWGRP